MARATATDITAKFATWMAMVILALAIAAAPALALEEIGAVEPAATEQAAEASAAEAVEAPAAQDAAYVEDSGSDAGTVAEDAGAVVEGETGTDESAAQDAVEDEPAAADEPAAEEAVEAAEGAEDDGAAADEAAETEAGEPAEAAETGDVVEPEVAQATEPAPATAPAPKAAPKAAPAKAPAVSTGDFYVSGDGDYAFADGVLTINGGKLTVKNRDASQATGNRIVVAGDSELTLAGVNIDVTLNGDKNLDSAVIAASSAAIKILAGVNAVFHLQGENSVTGGSIYDTDPETGEYKVDKNNNRIPKYGYAGIEVGFERGALATLTIDGDGKLTATGGANSAGIGGSWSNRNRAGASTASYHGSIVIESGTIVATGNGGGAGIGSGLNNARNDDGTSTGKSASYPMGYEEVGAITVNGGTVYAEGRSGGAGIGGGSHADSGLVTVNGGKVTAIGNGGGGAGIGNGIGSQSRESDGTKGPGSYFAEVVINGGEIDASSTWLGAGIGGGYSSDARVAINGGTIVASGGIGNSGANYQGGPGIGAGYMGLSVVEITEKAGATSIDARGGTGAPGIGQGAAALAQDPGLPLDQKKRGPDAKVSYDEAIVIIRGGTIRAEGGVNAAGIGTGNGDQVCHVAIYGGDIVAIGYSDPANLKAGGAGIGSGSGLKGAGAKYKSDTDAYVLIAGGHVLAIGGWGASAIGSGAENTQAILVTIDATKADIEAYADGTKFAIDTRVVDPETGATGTADNTSVTGNVLQATFVRKYEYEDDGATKSQNPEGLASVRVANESTGDVKALTGMGEYGLAGYRSFATTVANPGTFTVYTDDDAIGEGQGRYFAKCDTEFWDAENAQHGAQYVVETGKLADNCYLFPVKSVVVRKELAAVDGADLSGLSQTFYFALWIDAIGDYLRRADGSVWVESIDVVNGVARNVAMFIGVDDYTFGVWEVANAQGDDLPFASESSPVAFGEYRLVGITTRDLAGTSENDAVIGADKWSDEVWVINAFAAASDPEPQPAPEPVDDDLAPLAPGTPDEPSAPAEPATPAEPGPAAPAEPATPAEAIADAEVPLAAAPAAAAPATAAAAVAAAAPALAAAAAPAAAAIADDAAPLAAAPEAIEDEDTPLAGFADEACWVHPWVALGALATAVYGMAVLYRRRRSDDALAAYEEQVMGAAAQAAPAIAPAPALA